jgi:plastocyanin
LFILSSFTSKGTIHQIQVWSGYMQFLPPNNIVVQLGDTIQWTSLDPPTMSHTITSNNIPTGAVPFDQIWQMPADTFFQYIPQVAGLYQYVCTPHIPNGMIGEFTVINGSNTQTYVPDDNFEAYLEANGMGNGIANDDSVTTANINTVTGLLYVGGENIADLTGIEDFLNLTILNCENNQLTSLDISNNINLYFLVCKDNNLISLDLRNGNNNQFDSLWTYGNPNLTCISVDDSTYSTNNWTVNIDPQHYFSNNCSGPTLIQEHTTNKELFRITDLLGRETKETNQPLFYIYDDGTVEKKIIID